MQPDSWFAPGIDMGSSSEREARGSREESGEDVQCTFQLGGQVGQMRESKGSSLHRGPVVAVARDRDASTVDDFGRTKARIPANIRGPP